MNFLARLFFAVAVLFSVAANAQVRQSGTVTPGHVTCWTTSGIVQDCGTPGNPGASGGFGIVSGNQVSIGINSAATTGAYEQLSFGSTSTGGWLQYTPFGGAPNEPFNIVAPSLNFTIGGVTTPFSSLIAGVVIPSDTISSNITAGTAPASGNSLSSVLDAMLTATPGSVAYRGASGWVSLGPGTNGNCLTYVSAGPTIAWGSCAGSGGTGTVTSVATNNGLTGGTITTSGTLGLATITSGSVLANATGSTAAPSGTSVTALLDATLGSTRGAILERGASGWTILTPSSTTGVALVSNGTGADPSYQVPVLRGFLGGCGMANDVSNANTVIDTAACQTTSDDVTVTMVLAAFTKSTGSWTVGTGNGCLDAGSVANNTWYSVFVIERPDTGVVDELCSTSATSPTLPTNYTKKRRIGSFKTATGTTNILAFAQNGDRFDIGAPIAEFTGTPGVTTGVLRALIGVPSGVIVEAILSGTVSDSTSTNTVVYISSPAQTDVAATPAITSIVSPTNQNAPFAGVRILTDITAEIRYRVSSATGSITINSNGWIDRRGQQ